MSLPSHGMQKSSISPAIALQMFGVVVVRCLRTSTDLLPLQLECCEVSWTAILIRAPRIYHRNH